jgi:hypothetical protein
MRDRERDILERAVAAVADSQLNADALIDDLLGCRRCNRRVHWVAGLGVQPGHWAYAEPAPDPPLLATWLLAG